MKATKLKVVLFSTAALLTLSACGTSNSADNTKDTKTSSTVVTESSSEQASTTVSSMTENNAERFQKYEDVNQGKKPEEVYNEFISSVKNDESYGNDPLQNKNLTIVLYKPDCPDCQKAESKIMQEIQEGFSYAPTLMHDITIGKPAYEYHAVAVDITDGVPEWVQNIPCLADENNQYHTPTLAVVTPKKIDGTLYWDLMGMTTNTSDEMIESTSNYYMDLGAYKSYQQSEPVMDDQSTIK
ncbi:hypothetical protein JFG48_03900 [Enterococcus faecium]|nr:hypothetical protein [Enterococcus faecium]MBJ1148100.1 hypothetical protein [Enterococcus faecium]HAQ6379932.1 hypothetical protein [Enterococcus faecium]HAQ8896394.1 hypothetical protein [Enterococcus faecium]